MKIFMTNEFVFLFCFTRINVLRLSKQTVPEKNKMLLM